MNKVLKTLAKSVFILLRLTAEVSAIEAAVPKNKKIWYASFELSKKNNINNLKRRNEWCHKEI